ncbi:hypothetical protein Tco_0790993 [Tanacetum coccineum]
MAQKRATRSTPVTTTPAPTATTTTTVTNAQLQAMIDQGVSVTLAARDANRNGVDSHTLGTGGTEGVVEFTPMFSALTWWNSHVMTVTHDVAYCERITKKRYEKQSQNNKPDSNGKTVKDKAKSKSESQSMSNNQTRKSTGQGPSQP